MTTTSGEKRARIRALRREILQAKTYYFNKINPLWQKERELKNGVSPIGPLTSKLAANREQKWKEVKKELDGLKKERDEKIKDLKEELASLKQDYRENYDKYKKEEAKAKKDKVQNAKKDVKIFLDHYKFAIIGLGAIVLIIIIAIVVSTISNNIKIATEEGRNYFIDVGENYTYDCNAKYDGGFAAYCEDRFIGGVFSNYETVSFRKRSDIEVNGNSFKKKIYDYIDPSIYQKEDFDLQVFKKGMDKKYSFELWNSVLDRVVASKTVSVHYNLTDSDLSLISQLHEKWVVDEAEKAAQAQKEAEEREAREKKEAEEKARKEQEERAAREQAEKEEAERKAAEEEANKSYKLKHINNGEACPANAEYCYISGESSGYAQYGYGYLRGKIINNTGRNLNYIQVTASVYNSAGAKIGDCWGNSSGLAAGVTWEFEAYCTAWDYGGMLKDIDVSAY